MALALLLEPFPEERERQIEQLARSPSSQCFRSPAGKRTGRTGPKEIREAKDLHCRKFPGESDWKTVFSPAKVSSSESKGSRISENTFPMNCLFSGRVLSVPSKFSKAK